MEQFKPFLAELSSESLTVVVVGCVLIGVLIAAMPVAAWLSRKFDPRRKDKTGPVFDVSRLEGLHRSGQISQEEFRLLRRRALGLDSPGPKNDNPSSRPLSANDDVTRAPGMEAPDG